MITAKDKAHDLIYKSIENVPEIFEPDKRLELARNISLLIVNEIIQSKPTYPSYTGYAECLSDIIDDSVEYWNSVKYELVKL